MAVCDDCFQEFLHPLIHQAMEKNERFDQRYGSFDRWDWDADASVPTLSNAGGVKLRIDASVVGTTECNSWEWAWANRNFEPGTRLDMEKVREFGEANGYTKLLSEFLDADEYTGWEMTAVAVHILQSPGSYRFPTDGGYCYLAYRKIGEISRDTEDGLYGALRGTVTITPGIDITEPTGEVWKAESEK